MIKITSKTNPQIRQLENNWWTEVSQERYGSNVYTKPASFYFTAFDNEDPVGVANGRIKYGVLHLSSLIVAKEHRKKEIGKMLLERVLEYAKEQRAHKIELVTSAHFEAVHFYEKNGFEKTAVLPNHYRGEEFILFSKII